MPIYEYKCNACGHEFDRLCPISKRDDPGECPECGSNQVSRGVSRVASAKIEGGDYSSPGSSSCVSCSKGTCSTCGI